MEDFTQIDDVTDEQVDAIYAEIRGAFALSMKAEGVPPEQRERILQTVDDSVGNNL